jgi:Flp pilus assembly protein TadG
MVPRLLRERLEPGTSMLEMVIVLPLLLLVLFALAEFGILFGRWLIVNNATREGAREAVVFRADCDATSVETDVVSTVQNYASALGITITSSNVGVAGLCGGPGSDSTVNVTLPFAFQVLPGIAPSIGTNLDLTSSSTMRNEG